MTDRNWNPDHYKFEFPDVPPYEGTLVGTPVHHKVEKLRRFFPGEILDEVYRCLDAKAELAALILCLAAVDYLAGFYFGRQSKREDVKVFADKYFPAVYAPFLDDIYVQLRNGLMHNLAIRNPWHGHGTEFIIHPNSTNHLQQNEDGKTVFSVIFFCEDIRRAFWMYIYDVLMKAKLYPELVRNFHKRFNKLDGQGAAMERIPN
jgi:hypothetical protein